MTTETQKGCANCLEYLKKYEENPKSIRNRIWKWHTTWCPGWKTYREAAKAAGEAPGKGA